jgi:thiamine monophosphate synthase
VALGGMQPKRVREVMGTGVGAIAVSGAILQAEDPAMLLHQFCQEIDRTRL